MTTSSRALTDDVGNTASWVRKVRVYLTITSTHADRRYNLSSDRSSYNIEVEPRFEGHSDEFDRQKISLQQTRGGRFNETNKIRNFAHNLQFVFQLTYSKAEQKTVCDDILVVR